MKRYFFKSETKKEDPVHLGILLKEAEKKRAGGSAVGPVASPMAPFVGSGGGGMGRGRRKQTQAEFEKQQVKR